MAKSKKIKTKSKQAARDNDALKSDVEADLFPEEINDEILQSDLPNNDDDYNEKDYPKAEFNDGEDHEGENEERPVSNEGDIPADKKEVQTARNLASTKILGLGGGGFKKRPDDMISKYLYSALLIGGSILILLSKTYLNVSHTAVAFFACISIIVYGIAARQTQKYNHVRIDRIGDNCYYLGLTYTLVSLIAALWGISNGNVGQELLDNFGIALYSTATGIIMRLILMQFRTELDDAEVDARQRIMDTSDDFRRQLHSVISDFEIYHNSTKESLGRMRGNVMELLEDHSQKLVTTIGDSIDTINTRVKTADELLVAFEGRFVALENYTDRLGEAAKGLSERMDTVHTQPDVIEQAFERLAQGLDQTASKITNSANALQGKSETAMNFDGILEQLAQKLSRIDDLVGQMDENLKSQTQAVKVGTQVMQEHVKAMENYRLEAEAEAQKIRKSTEKFYGAMGDLAQTVVKGTNRGRG